MNKLTALELRRTSLRPYRIAALSIFPVMLGLLYLLASLPGWEPYSSDVDVLLDRSGVTGIVFVLGTFAFSMLFAAMAAKCVVEEYSGKRVVLLFSYPVARRKILGVKLRLVFGFTVLSALECGGVVLSIFILTECLFPLCSGDLEIGTVVLAFLGLLWSALLAGTAGLVTLWFGFRRKSVTATLTAGVILSLLVCQAMSAMVRMPAAWLILLAAAAVPGAFCILDLFRMAEGMEV